VVSPSQKRRAIKHVVEEGKGTTAEGCRALGLQRSTYYRTSTGSAERRRARHANHVWSWDFVEDQTEHGTRFRMLTLIDEFTRECLALHIAWSIRAVDVMTVIVGAIERYGVPEHIWSDNGPEFIAYAIQDWLTENRIKAIYYRAGRAVGEWAH
jgi:transposase InsO family protein